MPKQTLGVDIDGTLANTVGVFLEYLKKNRGIDVKKSEIVHYDMTRHMPISKKEISQIWTTVWEDHQKIPLEDLNAPRVLKQLSNTFEIHIVTATNAGKENLKSWLYDNQIPYDKIQHFEGQIHKVDSKVDVQIDDCFEIIDLFVKKNMRLILLEQPWNKSHHALVKDEKLVSIAKNWKDIEGLLDRQ